MSVDLKIIEGVAYLTFDRPEAVNAISGVMFGQLADRLVELTANPDVRATVLRGAGGNFSSGADIKNLSRRWKNNWLSRSKGTRPR